MARRGDFAIIPSTQWGDRRQIRARLAHRKILPVWFRSIRAGKSPVIIPRTVDLGAPCVAMVQTGHLIP